VESYDLPEVL